MAVRMKLLGEVGDEGGLHLGVVLDGLDEVSQLLEQLLCGGLDGADGVGQDPGAALSSQLVLLCGT